MGLDKTDTPGTLLMGALRVLWLHPRHPYFSSSLKI